MRMLWTMAGWLCFSLGFIGAFLPLLPTVPFMLLAAYCFARGSERFHEWLINHPTFGPPILDWMEHGTISRRSKNAAGIAIALAFSISLIVGVSSTVLAIQAVVLGCVSIFIFTRHEGPRRKQRSRD